VTFPTDFPPISGSTACHEKQNGARLSRAPRGDGGAGFFTFARWLAVAPLTATREGSSVRDSRKGYEQARPLYSRILRLSFVLCRVMKLSKYFAPDAQAFTTITRTALHATPLTLVSPTGYLSGDVERSSGGAMYPDCVLGNPPDALVGPSVCCARSSQASRRLPER
jgi:hypothetical protein